MDFEDPVRTLTKLGLTLNQARVYLILAESAVSTASQISKISKLAREEVYRVIPKLQDLGLIEIIVGTPTKYKAQPLNDGIRILLNRKTDEDKKLREEAENLLKHHTKLTPELTIPEESDSKFSLLRDGLDIQTRGQAVEDAMETIDAVETLSRLLQIPPNQMKTTIKTLKRGVKLRLVIYAERENEHRLRDYVKQFECPNFEARHCFTKPTAYMALCDNKLTFLSTELEADLDKETALVSENACLAKLAKEYFERIWHESQKIITS